MSQTVLVAILTGLFTLGGVLGSQYLSQRSAGRLAIEERRATAQRALDEREFADRREMRVMMTDFLRAARKWTSSTWLMGMTVAQSEDKSAAMRAWIATPGNERHTQEAETVAKTGGQLALTIADPQLHALVRSWLTDYSGDWTKSMAVADAKERDLTARLDAIEARAAEVLRGTI